MPRITLYSKADCHLCDAAKERIEEVRGRVAFDLDIVDIANDSDLMDRHGERIPVVELDGKELFVYRVNSKVLEKKLRGAPSPLAAIRRRMWPDKKDVE